MRKFMTVLTAIVLFGTLAADVSFCESLFETSSLTINGLELNVQVAVSERARRQGLMNRNMVPEGTGMLFVYPSVRICRLWMRNTLVPLSAAFIDSQGRITEIVRMPRINSQIIYESKKKVSFALEVPMGYFEKNGIAAGDISEIPREYLP